MTTNVVGLDGHSPVYNPEDSWHMWKLAEIYTGQVGFQRYVPKIGDWVKDTDTNVDYEVTLLDPTTLVPTLTEKKAAAVDEFTDVLLGVGPGTQSDTYRLYRDASKTPNTLAVDARLHVAGTMAATCKIFKGSDLTGDAAVISNFYDNAGNLLGNAIPLELVAMDSSSGTNISIKTVPVCYTTQDLSDGELVTAVFFAADGHVVSKRQLLVENTAFIRSSNSSLKYVTGIALKTPFLSPSDPMLVQYPLNVPLEGLQLIGVVNYSDGSSVELPVDGTKFSVFGFERFVSSIVGQQFSIVLKYVLSAGEICYTANAVSNDRFVSEVYKATTLNEDGAYSVKLFGYPVWGGAVSGYQMEWYMYNLDRQAAWHVTPYVSYNANQPVFDGLRYGANQHLSVSVNLKDVNPTFKNYTHTQTLDVVLFGPGTLRTTNWTVGFDPNQSPPYGIGDHADTVFTNANLATVNISCGETDFNAWLNRLYSLTKPLTDPQQELAPPAPTHFSIVLGGQDVVFPIASWNQTIVLNQALTNNGTLFVKFFKRTADNDIQLAIAALPIYQTN